MTLNAVKEKTINQNWQMIASQEHLDMIKQNKEINVTKIGLEPPADINDGTFFNDSSWAAKDVNLPNCWEKDGFWKGFCGPVWYRKEFKVSKDWYLENQQVLLHFGAVSYYCTVWLNGQKVGEHRGMWDNFQFDITPYLAEENTLILEIHKPGDYFPVKSSLAGFVPYVTTTFGGIWQEVKLMVVDQVRIEDLQITPDIVKNQIDLKLKLDSQLTNDREVDIVFTAEDNYQEIRQVLKKGRNLLDIELPIADPKLWSPGNPYLYQLDIKVKLKGKELAHLTKKFGMREVSVEGNQIKLNKQPFYPRGVLHWVAYPDIIAPHPAKERIIDEIKKMKELGYNLIKLCLVIPSSDYFELADELGMLLWVELPMWMPAVDEGFARRAKEEYRQILTQVRNYPSVAMYTLGCELDDEIGAGLLKELYQLVKNETDSPLVKDNSGSAEAYGGVDREYADFYDYHFYAETNQFPDLIDYFYPKWKEEKPLLFGEYCDSDTIRSVKEIEEQVDYPLWWKLDDPVVNPQGVRWTNSIIYNEERLAEFPLDINFNEIKKRSYMQSTEYRKDILEQTRKRTDTSGYVITNIIDTPLSTAGMLDVLGNIKFDPGKFSQFNADTVLTFARDKRRIWQNGGDRPQYIDEFNNFQNQKFRINLLISHYGPEIKNGQIEWQLSREDQLEEQLIKKGNIKIKKAIETGYIGKIGDVEVILPEDTTIYPFKLEVKLISQNKVITTNEWNYWAIPEITLEDWNFTLWDKRGIFPEISETCPNLKILDDIAEYIPQADEVVVATAWTEEIKDWLNNGVKVFLIMDKGDGKLVEAGPFWREGVELIQSHPVIDQLPHQGYPGIQFKGVTPEVYLKKERLEEKTGVELTPVISRLDARDFLTNYYLLAGTAKKGSLLITSFKPGGGFAREPIGVPMNVLGTYLIDRGVSYLRTT